MLWLTASLARQASTIARVPRPKQRNSFLEIGGRWPAASVIGPEIPVTAYVGISSPPTQTASRVLFRMTIESSVHDDITLEDEDLDG